MEKREIKFKTIIKFEDGSIKTFIRHPFDAHIEDTPEGNETMPDGAEFLSPQPLQFTGLQDKKGKDIYEGDIMQWTAKFRDTDMPTPPKRGEVKYNQEMCRYYISYELNNKHYYKELIATSGGAYYQTDTIEIIGNIFQNPELIK